MVLLSLLIITSSFSKRYESSIPLAEE